MAKDSKKNKEPKLVRREVNRVAISANEILSSLTTTVQLNNINAGGNEFLSEVMSQMAPAVHLRQVLEPHFEKLTSNLSDFRTRHAVRELEIEIEHVTEFEENDLFLRLFAKTETKGVPDRPAMSGQQAKQILENCFGDFDIDVDMTDAEKPLYSQKTRLTYDLGSMTGLTIPQALPTPDVCLLYLNIVHNICGVVQDHDEDIERIQALQGGQVESVSVPEFKEHVRFRNGREEPVKKKKQTRKK